MNAPNRTFASLVALSAVGFAALGVAHFAAARWAGFGPLAAGVMAALLAGGGWFGLYTVATRPSAVPVRRSGHALAWLSLTLLLVGAMVGAVRPGPATGPLIMEMVSGMLPLVGLALYWNVLARRRAAAG